MGNTTVLKQEIVEKIKNDALLFGKVADMLDVKPVTLPRLLATNHRKLIHHKILAVIRKHLGITSDSELLTEIPNSVGVEQI